MSSHPPQTKTILLEFGFTKLLKRIQEQNESNFESFHIWGIQNLENNFLLGHKRVPGNLRDWFNHILRIVNMEPISLKMEWTFGIFQFNQRNPTHPPTLPYPLPTHPSLPLPSWLILTPPGGVGGGGQYKQRGGE